MVLRTASRRLECGSRHRDKDSVDRVHRLTAGVAGLSEKVKRQRKISCVDMSTRNVTGHDLRI